MYILAFIIALLASWVLTPYVKKLAFRIGALDKPDGRKVHHGIMPRLGGLAIYLAFVIAVLATMISAGIPLRKCVEIANRAGGIVVGKLGTATVSFEELFPSGVIE